MKLLLTNIILGSILLYSYYHYGQNKNALQLWGKIDKMKLAFIISMILAAISYLIILFILTKNNIKKIILNKILVTQIILIIFSILWMPFSLKYLQTKNNNYKYLVILVLGIVALSALVQLYLLKDTNKILLFSGLYFFFHVFVMDFIIWDINFFQ